MHYLPFTKSSQNQLDMQLLLKTRISSRKSTTNFLTKGRMMWFMSDMNVAGALVKPKPMTVNSLCPKGVLMAVFGISRSSTRTCSRILKSSLLKYFAPRTESNRSSIEGRQAWAFTVILFKWRQSHTILKDPSAFRTKNTGARYGDLLGRMKPRSSISFSWLWSFPRITSYYVLIGATTPMTISQNPVKRKSIVACSRENILFLPSAKFMHRLSDSYEVVQPTLAIRSFEKKL